MTLTIATFILGLALYAPVFVAGLMAAAGPFVVQRTCQRAYANAYYA